MNIRQQKQIRTFLVREFGPDKGRLLFAQQKKLLHALVDHESGRSKIQTVTLVQMIYPCIALYKVLSGCGLSEDASYDLMRRYMLDYAAAQQHSALARAECIPGFYSIYSAAFLKVMRTAGLWESTQAHSRDHFDITIKKCLWHTACAENGCAGLCPLFCDADNVTYGGLKKIGFTRTSTLGYGGDCCDFHFFRK